MNGSSSWFLQRGTNRPFVWGLSLALTALGAWRGAPAGSASNPPNIVLILTDDQRWDTLWAMPAVQAELVGKGVTFENGFVVRSLCCPSRTSILTGQYSHTTTMYKNAPPYGGFDWFDDSSTVATWMDGAGYRTGFIGKYLTGYAPPYVPPGWDRWVVFSDVWDYFNYSLSIDGEVVSFGSDEQDYSTDVFAAEAEAFIRTADPGDPLFLVLAPLAPHRPLTPAPRHQGAFSDLRPYRPPNYNELDVSDKPDWVQARPRLGKRARLSMDIARILQYRMLLAVDEAVNLVVRALNDTGRLQDTMIVFASDNGKAIGEHRWDGKLVAFEESIRVPFVVRYDPLIQVPGTYDGLVANIDLAPTFAELAGVEAPDAEGHSLIPLLSSPDPPWRTDFLIEHMDGLGVPTFCAVRNETSTYVAYSTGEEELYDLTIDPYQLDNVASDPGRADQVRELRSRLRVLCDPPPPGFRFPDDALPPSAPFGLTPSMVGGW
jgi:N-acetylglucosamine-6-sulfatase